MKVVLKVVIPANAGNKINHVIPANAGICNHQKYKISAFAGMTLLNYFKQQIILFLFFSTIPFTLIAQNDSSQTIKVRLPNIINQYQPAIIPVLSLDGKYLYFDRKVHPENIGGIADEDDIWYSEKLSNGVWSEPQNIGSSLNTAYSDLIFSLIPDGSKALVYGKYISEGEKKPGFSFAEGSDGKWSAIVPLNIENYYNKSKNYYASLSADCKTLILAIERDDSYGDLDLYFSHYNDSTRIWSVPQNLGNSVNTNGVEGSPFLAYDNKTLYFSSNGREGYGKLDLFISRRLDDTWKNWSKPQNLGAPINTQFDESSIWLTALGDTAYIVSSDTVSLRAGIYYVKLPKKMQPLPYLIINGIIYEENKKSTGILPLQAELTITYWKSENSFKTYSKRKNGEYLFVIPGNSNYKINVNSIGYEPQEFSIDTRGIQTPAYQTKDIFFKKSVPPDNKSFIIYFETAKVELDKEAEQSIIEFFSNINDINSIKLLISGHADERGGDSYNTELSKMRAENTAVFIKKLGINSENIEVEWKGESFPISKDKKKNRRVEILIKNP